MTVFQTGNLRVEKPSPEFAVLWLEVAGRSLNVLNRQVLQDLESALDHLLRDQCWVRQSALHKAD